MSKHWMGILCLGLMLCGCQAPLPEPAQFNSSTIAVPAVQDAIPAIKEVLDKKHLTNKDGWDFKFLKAVKGTHTAKQRSDEKTYSGWFMCGVYAPLNVLGYHGVSRPFMAYFNPADGKFLYLIEEDWDLTANGCNRLYGTRIITTEAYRARR